MKYNMIRASQQELASAVTAAAKKIGENESATSLLSGVTALAVRVESIMLDKRVIAFAAGVGLGLYFGFRIGVVSALARRYVSSVPFMRAVAVLSYDGVDAVQVVTVERPDIADEDDILIEVKAASLDNVDIRVSQGYGRRLRDLVNRYNPNVSANNFPVILGRDGAGVVTKCGKQAEMDYRPGDRVWFVVPHYLQGSLANYIVLKRELVRRPPLSLSFEAAASLPYASAVAWELLVTHGGLSADGRGNEGKRIFVWGGFRGTERILIQLAKHWRCHVTCFAPEHTHDYLKSLGVDALVADDMRQLEDFAAGEHELFDLVVNTSGPVAEETCLRLCNDTGTVVSTLTSAPGLREYGLYAGMAVRFLNFFCELLLSNLLPRPRSLANIRPDPDVLDLMRELVDLGDVEPIAEAVYDAERAEEAFRTLAAGGHRGKIVVRMEEFARVCPVGQHALCA